MGLLCHSAVESLVKTGEDTRWEIRQHLRRQADFRQRHSDLSKKMNRIVRLMRTMSMSQSWRMKKDIDLRLPVARLAAVIGPTFAEL
jgi:hypothetical protein